MSEQPVSLAWVNLTQGGMSGGYRKYMEAVLPRLAEDARFGSISILSPRGMTGVVVPSRATAWRWPSRDAWLGYPQLRQQLRARDADVVYVPSARWVDPGASRFVVMFRNMEPVTRPFGENGLAEGAKNIARRIAGHSACARADSVIAVSDFVAEFLNEQWSIPSKKIEVIYHGLSKLAKAPSRPKSIHVGQRFVFTAGSIRPFRGLADAIGALVHLPPSLGDLSLVIAGRIEGRVHGYMRELRNLAESLGLAARITWAGYLQDEEMAWCFGNCAAFAMTSRVEACPNTALEAMSYGAACVATTNAPMPEFFGDAAIYYSAGDRLGLAQAIASLVSDRDATARYQSEARKRIEHFSWDRTVEQTAALLIRVARGKKSKIANR
jgi:glycosyltransferase involved in cell wall biosynthesis